MSCATVAQTLFSWRTKNNGTDTTKSTPEKKERMAAPNVVGRYFFVRIVSVEHLNDLVSERPKRKCICTHISMVSGDLQPFQHRIYLFIFLFFFCRANYYLPDEKKLWRKETAIITTTTTTQTGIWSQLDWLQLRSCLRLESRTNEPIWNNFPHNERQLITIRSNGGDQWENDPSVCGL